MDTLAPYHVAYVAAPPTLPDPAQLTALRLEAHRAQAVRQGATDLYCLLLKAGHLSPLAREAASAHVDQLKDAAATARTVYTTAFAALENAQDASATQRAVGDNRGRPGYITDQEYEAHLARTDERWQ